MFKGVFSMMDDYGLFQMVIEHIAFDCYFFLDK